MEAMLKEEMKRAGKQEEQEGESE